MKLGIAGAGMIVVQGLLEFVHDIEGIELLGICATKRSEEKLKKLSEEHGIAHTYTDYEEMLKLDENERSTQIRLMKVKDMMLEKAHHYHK